jgi:hypothetical protein
MLQVSKILKIVYNIMYLKLCLYIKLRMSYVNEMIDSLSNNNKTKEELISIIKKEIPYVDKKPYSHNIINIQLEILGKKYGMEEAKKLIKKTKLKNLGWGHILKMNE